jgi:hypothetical protein
MLRKEKGLSDRRGLCALQRIISSVERVSSADVSSGDALNDLESLRILLLLFESGIEQHRLALKDAVRFRRFWIRVAQLLHPYLQKIVDETCFDRYQRLRVNGTSAVFESQVPMSQNPVADGVFF